MTQGIAFAGLRYLRIYARPTADGQIERLAWRSRKRLTGAVPPYAFRVIQNDFGFLAVRHARASERGGAVGNCRALESYQKFDKPIEGYTKVILSPLPD